MSDFLGKTSKRRPCLVSREELDLRWTFAWGKITREQFDEKLKQIRDKEDAKKK